MDELIAAQHRFDEAELHADRDALEELIADDFRSIGPKGFVMDKRQWIERHDLFRYHELDTSDMEVSRYGDAAIVRDVQTNHASYGDQEVRLRVRVSQTWVKSDGDRWQLAGIQFSPMATA
jgi:hypothetical protein